MKLVLCGDSKVGKTTFLTKFCRGREENSPGCDGFGLKEFILNNHAIKLQIFDLNDHAARSFFYLGCTGAIVFLTPQL